MGAREPDQSRIRRAGRLIGGWLGVIAAGTLLVGCGNATIAIVTAPNTVAPKVAPERKLTAVQYSDLDRISTQLRSNHQDASDLSGDCAAHGGGPLIAETSVACRHLLAMMAGSARYGACLKELSVATRLFRCAGLTEPVAANAAALASAGRALDRIVAAQALPVRCDRFLEIGAPALRDLDAVASAATGISTEAGERDAHATQLAMIRWSAAFERFVVDTEGGPDKVSVCPRA